MKQAIIVAIAILSGLSPKVFAQEKISNFDVEMSINHDASVSVFEKVDYDFGQEERHGIFRYIPVKYATPLGSKSITLEVGSVTRDGLPEEYEEGRSGSDKNIKIGDADVTISGPHEYGISYTLRKSIGYFDDYDEIYWNVTGNGWTVPIEEVNVRVSVPDGVAEGDIMVSCYQGVYGSEEACPTSRERRIVLAKSSRVLGPGEDLTIAVGFPKGAIYRPTTLDAASALLKDNYILFLPIIVLFMMFFAWKRHGKDPKGLSTIIAEYEPPEGMKPALAGALIDGRAERKDITAGLIYLAEQGYAGIRRIEKEGIFGSVDYELILERTDIGTLEKTEKDILESFFGPNSSKGATIRISELKKDAAFPKKTSKILDDMYQDMTDRGFYVRNPLRAKLLYIFIAAGILVLGISLMVKMFGLAGFISALLSAAIVLVFGLLMGKKTKLGAETRSRLLGFREFLSVTEKDRLAFHNAPEKTGEQFMRFLPYAVAMGVEKKWAKQFEGVYIPQPSWYHGNFAGTFVALSFAGEISDFSSRTTANMISAASGGSGSGGGGFSGGGFGGGGGGSW